MLLTLQDLIEHGLAYLGGNSERASSDRVRGAVLRALQEIPHRHQWSYYRSIGRVVTVAHYNTGTIAYDHTGGSNERELTLSDGTWPSWAASGVIVIADVPYEISTRVSDSVLTLGTAQNPGEDVASGTSYTLYQDTYSLPSDFLSMGALVVDAIGYEIVNVQPNQWVEMRRRNVGPAKPQMFCVVGGGSVGAGMTLRLWPPPDAVYQADFPYKRKMRALLFDERKAGTASVTASGTTVTGSGTSFTSAMAGSVIRLGSNAADAPTGEMGFNPAVQERIIDTVSSSTSLTVTSAFDSTYSGVKYVISDPVDIDRDVMERYVLREVERQCRIITRMKKIDAEDREYTRALMDAKAADSRFFGERVAGVGEFRSVRLSDYPRGTEFQ